MTERTRMNPDARALWLEALRSGEYAQGRGQLTRITNDEALHCCLGVLCEVAVRAGVELNVREVPLTGGVVERWYDEQENYPPQRVLDWAGLDSNNPQVRRPGGESVTMSMLNDELGASFAEIADLVEEQL